MADETNTTTNQVSTDGVASTETKDTSDSQSTIKEVPITNYDEALAFGMRQLGKQRRKSGHKIELKVIGNTDFKVGEWIHVFMPTYNEDCFMFISKASVEAGADEEFITSLTLVDYPPSLGAGNINSTGSSTDDSTDSSTNTNTTNNTT